MAGNANHGGCNCCNTPPCDQPTLVCETVSVSKSKCGYPEWSGHVSTPPKIYAKKVTRIEGSSEGHLDSSYTDPVWDVVTRETHNTVIDSVDFTITSETAKDGCGETVAYSGTGTSTKTDESISRYSDGTMACDYTVTYDVAQSANPDGSIHNVANASGSGSGDGCPDDYTEPEAYSDGGMLTEESGSLLHAYMCGYASSSITSTATVKTKTITATTGSDPDKPCSASQTDTTTLSDEFTTSQLIAIALSHVPAYRPDPDNPEDEIGPPFNQPCPNYGWGGEPGRVCFSCSSFRNLSTDETSYSIRRVRWKIRHMPTGTCYLKVWLRLRFRPEGTTGSADTFTPLPDYEWRGSGNPCFANAEKAYNYAGSSVPSENNVVFSEQTETLEPATDGTVFIEIVKWSALEGYTPDDPNDDGTRPDPDNKPNCYPVPTE